MTDNRGKSLKLAPRKRPRDDDMEEDDCVKKNDTMVHKNNIENGEVTPLKKTEFVLKHKLFSFSSSRNSSSPRESTAPKRVIPVNVRNGGAYLSTIGETIRLDKIRESSSSSSSSSSPSLSDIAPAADGTATSTAIGGSPFAASSICSEIIENHKYCSSQETVVHSPEKQAVNNDHDTNKSSMNIINSINNMNKSRKSSSSNPLKRHRNKNIESIVLGSCFDKNSTSALTDSKLDVKNLALLSRNRYYEPVREPDNRLIEVVCKHTKSVPVCFGSVLDASQALQLTKKLVRQACHVYDESKESRRDDAKCEAGLPKKLDALSYWLRFTDNSGAYHYGVHTKDFLPRSRMKHVLPRSNSTSALALDDESSSLQNTTTHENGQGEDTASNPNRTDSPKAESRSLLPDKQPSSEMEEIGGTIASNNSSRSPSLKAFESFKVAAAVSSAVTAAARDGSLCSIKREQENGDNDEKVQPAEPMCASSHLSKNDKVKMGAEPIRQSAVACNKETLTTGNDDNKFDVSTLLPLSRTKYYEPAKTPEGIIEVKCRATGRVPVCFGNILDASLGLGTSKKLIKRALKMRHEFPNFSLRYVKHSKAYQYGAHDADFLKDPPIETHEARMQRWQKKMKEGTDSSGQNVHQIDHKPPPFFIPVHGDGEECWEDISEDKDVVDVSSSSQKSKDVQEDYSCICLICQEKPVQIVFHPCHHCVVCATCASFLCKKFCPQCRVPIAKRLKPAQVQRVRPRVYSASSFLWPTTSEA